jgi:hypothetical protein
MKVPEWIAECADQAPIETAVEIAAEAAAAFDVANQAEQTAACARERLLEFAEVGFECEGLKVVERVIESIPPEEIVALRKRLAAEGKLDKRIIRAVIRTGED